MKRQEMAAKVATLAHALRVAAALIDELEEPLPRIKQPWLNRSMCIGMANEYEDAIEEVTTQARRDAEHAIGLDGRCVACERAA